MENSTRGGYSMITKEGEAEIDKLEQVAYAHPNTWVIVSEHLRIRFIPGKWLECRLKVRGESKGRK